MPKNKNAHLEGLLSIESSSKLSKRLLSPSPVSAGSTDSRDVLGVGFAKKIRQNVKWFYTTPAY